MLIGFGCFQGHRQRADSANVRVRRKNGIGHGALLSALKLIRAQRAYSITPKANPLDSCVGCPTEDLASACKGE